MRETAGDTVRESVRSEISYTKISSHSARASEPVEGTRNRGSNRLASRAISVKYHFGL